MADPVVDRLINALTRTDSRGERIFSDAALDELIPFLVMSTSFEDAAPSPALVAKMNAFFVRAGIDPKMPADEIQKAVDAWFAKHPPSRALMQAVEEVLLGAEVDESSQHAEAANTNLLGARDMRPVGARGDEGYKLGGMAQFALRGALEIAKEPEDVPIGEDGQRAPNMEYSS